MGYKQYCSNGVLPNAAVSHVAATLSLLDKHTPGLSHDLTNTLRSMGHDLQLLLRWFPFKMPVTFIVPCSSVTCYSQFYWLNVNAGYDGDVYLTIVLNGFIHTVMYTYYFVSMHTKDIWWKKYLTLMQVCTTYACADVPNFNRERP